MSWRPERRAWWVEAANATGRAFAGAAPAILPLEAGELLARARSGTGLVDFGGAAFREPLAVLVRALEEEAQLTLLGRVMARREILGALTNRLELQDVRRRHPEIEDESIRAPVFVTGSGRSGTSILHELLALDPAHRAPLSWEMLFPCPPPETATYAHDPRIARADRALSLWDALAPEYRRMHEMGGAVPQECLYITTHEFLSEHFSGCYEVPSYARYLAQADRRPAYTFHRRMLQVLQWRCPGERWVLKAPAHLATLDALFSVYPDARIVQTHRDPLVVIASMTNLMCNLLWMRSDRVDPHALGRRAAAGVAHLLERATQFRAAGHLPEAQVIDVHYRDLVRDPIRTLARIYAHFGLELSGDVASRVRTYLTAKPAGRHGAHRYRFEDTGLDRDRERARFAAYQRRFEVASEI